MALINLEKGTRVLCVPCASSPEKQKRILNWPFTKRISSVQRSEVQRPDKKASTIIQVRNKVLLNSWKWRKGVDLRDTKQVETIKFDD